MKTATYDINTYYNKFIQFAKYYNAKSYFKDGMLIIQYPILGDGSLISQMIEDYMMDKDYEVYNVKMNPSEQTLEITVK